LEDLQDPQLRSQVRGPPGSSAEVTSWRTTRILSLGHKLEDLQDPQLRSQVGRPPGSSAKATSWRTFRILHIRKKTFSNQIIIVSDKYIYFTN